MKVTTTLCKKLGIKKQEAQALVHLARHEINDGQQWTVIDAEFELSDTMNISHDSAMRIIFGLSERNLCWTDDWLDGEFNFEASVICSSAIVDFVRYNHEAHLDKFIRRQQQDGVSLTADLVLRKSPNPLIRFDEEMEKKARECLSDVEELEPYKELLQLCKGERDVAWAACLAFGQWSLNRRPLGLTEWLHVIQPNLADRSALRNHLNTEHLVFTQAILEAELEEGKVVSIKPTAEARAKFNLDRDYEPEFNATDRT